MNGIIFDWVGTLAERGRKLFPFSKEVLINLKSRGYKLGLVSIAGFGIERRWEDLQETGVIDFFDSIQIDVIKTPKHYLDCMKSMRTLPDSTIIVDNEMMAGIKLGNKLGCRTVWIQKGEYAHEIPNEDTGEPTYKIDSVKDLITLL